ncbi:D-alanyl-D-alanine carboxypeptidase [Streptomyces kunmingensis]|uniref:D-alanyl-D-alanine carboxypeptidase n=1 Tax=Streptomyces kunmingensis TaxID=68225 RepID=A0ABU6C2N5_9ACTN|nr:D-alanyl-D-alanine carboxypeptidase [Streptomyces kunmingensis]MEB3958914.1 D-alanyl-D-alanine carboxypeptidase [Streptomyces kunmingensis]
MSPVTVPGEPQTLPPVPRHQRRWTRSPHGPRFAACVTGAVLLTIGALLTTLVRSGGSDAGRPPGSAASLPWPAQGQTSVLVEGLGTRGELGTRGAQKPVPIASVTKVMTAYVILRGHPLRAKDAGPDITVDQQAAGESVLGGESTVPVERGVRLSERQVLELMLIPSGGNIARLLARWDAGSEEAFVAKMNGAARALGMTDTEYTDASGIARTTVSTSADQLRLARKVMHDPAFRSIVAMEESTVPGLSGPVRNTNTLLGREGVVGGKTGSSTPAGGNLMWAATAQDRTGHTRLILGVVLHQEAGTSSEQGLRAALTSSRELIGGVRQWVSTVGRPGR